MAGAKRRPPNQPCGGASVPRCEDAARGLLSSVRRVALRSASAVQLQVGQLLFFFEVFEQSILIVVKLKLTRKRCCASHGAPVRFREGASGGVSKRGGHRSGGVAAAPGLHWQTRGCPVREEPLSPGPYRSFRELSLSGLVGSDTWRPPTFVGNPGSSAPTAGAAPHVFVYHRVGAERRDPVIPIIPAPPRALIEIAGTKPGDDADAGCLVSAWLIRFSKRNPIFAAK